VAKLEREQIVTIRVLNERGQSASRTARLLGVTEGTVRYHLRRQGVTDGRAKEFLVERLGLADAVTTWWQSEESRLPDDRPPSVRGLFDHLVAEHDYPGSYKSVRVFARSRFGTPRLRSFRRVETPAGAQTQTDWGEVSSVDVGDASGPTGLCAFVMVLSHSRKEAAIWSRSMDQLAWHRCHNEAYRRLGGVAAVNRIDNLKTGVSRGAGAWGTINARYLTYAKTMGFHVDACESSAPEQKGKTERRVGVLKSLDVGRRRHESLEALQAWTDAALERRADKRVCPATGLSVTQSWQSERKLLRPLPETLPEPFDAVASRRVERDCSVRFEGRTYVVPFAYVGLSVEVRGCSQVVQVVDPATGEVLVTYPRHSAERILIDERCYEGASTDRVRAPKPLGRMSRKLAELAATPVERRPVDLYAALAEAAR